MKSFLLFIWEVAKIVIIALVIVIPIRYFLFQPFFVKGQSMEPNFENGDYLIVDELSYRLRSPQRGEIIVFKYPNNPSDRYIKRIIGLPGETVEIKDGKIVIIDKEGQQTLDESKYLSSTVFTTGFTSGNSAITLEAGEYLVLGDNRPVSSDSRFWGALPREDIVGRVIFRAWPFTRATTFGEPVYY